VYKNNRKETLNGKEEEEKTKIPQKTDWRGSSSTIKSKNTTLKCGEGGE